ncbi:MAG: phosphohydrolase [Lachnospiraceae bacterium]|jgi:HD superfamily phosphodiesterase|nr:phosphohydrolase [Lachnospiraceae bacterium]
MINVNEVMKAMFLYYSGDPRRIQHFIKVHSYAKIIGEMEQLDNNTQEMLEVTAVIHDIGIKVSEEKYNSSAGNYQQIEGPAVAKKMLTELGYCKEFIDRSCYLIAHHHTYKDIDGIDYQILVEADFLVNIYEEEIAQDKIAAIRDKIFRTQSGILLLNNIYRN